MTGSTKRPRQTRRQTQNEGHVRHPKQQSHLCSQHVVQIQQNTLGSSPLRYPHVGWKLNYKYHQQNVRQEAVTRCNKQAVWPIWEPSVSTHYQKMPWWPAERATLNTAPLLDIFISKTNYQQLQNITHLFSKLRLSYSEPFSSRWTRRTSSPRAKHGCRPVSIVHTSGGCL